MAFVSSSSLHRRRKRRHSGVLLLLLLLLLSLITHTQAAVRGQVTVRRLAKEREIDPNDTIDDDKKKVKTTSAIPSVAPSVQPTGTASATPTPAPTTAAPTTAAPTTAEPTTAAPTTLDTAEPTTAEPTTAEPSTAEPTTLEPTTAEPSTAEPSTAEPSTAEPSTAEPSTAEPSTAEPTILEPRSAALLDFNLTLAARPNIVSLSRVLAQYLVDGMLVDPPVAAVHLHTVRYDDVYVVTAVTAHFDHNDEHAIPDQADLWAEQMQLLQQSQNLLEYVLQQDLQAPDLAVTAVQLDDDHDHGTTETTAARAETEILSNNNDDRNARLVLTGSLVGFFALFATSLLLWRRHRYVSTRPAQKRRRRRRTAQDIV